MGFLGEVKRILNTQDPDAVKESQIKILVLDDLEDAIGDQVAGIVDALLEEVSEHIDSSVKKIMADLLRLYKDKLREFDKSTQDNTIREEMVGIFKDLTELSDLGQGFRFTHNDLDFLLDALVNRAKRGV